MMVKNIANEKLRVQHPTEKHITTVELTEIYDKPEPSKAFSKNVVVFGEGQFRAEAPFVFEPNDLQVVAASFDGYIKDVYVEVGDLVKRDQTVLANLDTAELRLKLAAAKAEKAGYTKLGLSEAK